MSDRLEELRRQRALVQHHLEWLDREIADAGSSPPGVPVTPSPSVTPHVPRAVARLTATSSMSAVAGPARALPDPDAILAQYRSEHTTVKSDVRRGCLLYFVAALALLALGVMALYYLLPRR